MSSRRLIILTIIILAIAGIALARSIDESSSADWSIARYWDEQMLKAIRMSLPRPPPHARNLYHVSAAMYDAWATYDPVARGVFFREKNFSYDVDAARDEAISYAAYRMLEARFGLGSGPNYQTVLGNLEKAMKAAGYDPAVVGSSGSAPAAIGNRIAQTIIARTWDDGANEAGNYASPGYKPVNKELVFKLPGTEMIDPDRWQPLAFDFLVTQNGIPVGAGIQTHLCPHWRAVQPFALRPDQRNDATGLYFDPGPPPRIGSQEIKDYAVELILKSSIHDPRITDRIDVSPSAFYNNSLGADDGHGYSVNPATGQPYPPNLVRISDFSRIVVEFWADGPSSETPPGHWHVVANDVSDELGDDRRFRGGEPMDRLEWDVKIYLAMSGGSHDAAIGSWGAKGLYDSHRPLSFIRHMAQLGQSSDPTLPSFHPDGLPLVPGLIELVKAEDVAPGGRFEDFPEFTWNESTWEPNGVDDHVGDIAIRAWLGGYSAGAASSDASLSATMPGQVYRDCSGAWKVGGWDLGTNDTPGAANGSGCTLPTAVRINEVRLAQIGADRDEFLELAGPANASLDGLWYVVLGAETQTKVASPHGRVQLAIDLTGKKLGSDGYYLIADPTLSLPTQIDLPLRLELSDLENATHMLVRGFSSFVGFDCDVPDTGTLSYSPWTSIADSVALRDNPRVKGGIYSTTEVGPEVASKQQYGSGWILADRWMPYMASNFVTPPFAGYTSGHSTFSRSSAEVMTYFTGSKFFPGGKAGYTFEKDKFLKFEKGPSETVTLSWATYYDASDEASQSRRWGGIHPIGDDYPARVMGSKMGKCAAGRAFALFEGLERSPDIDCSGTVDAADRKILNDTMGPCPKCGADLDGDDVVDRKDLEILLGAMTKDVRPILR